MHPRQFISCLKRPKMKPCHYHPSHWLWVVCAAIEEKTSEARVPQACIPAIRKPDGELEHDSLAKLELLKKSFFLPPPAVRLDDTVGFHYPASINIRDITESEILRVINRPRPYKAAGPTGIPNRILQVLSTVLLPTLHTLFSACYEISHCPKAFENSTTVVLKKPESGDPTNPRDYTAPKSYRPIALLETFSKVFETIMASRLLFIAEAFGLLPEGHMGGRQCTSTEHAVHSLVEKIVAAWNKKKKVVSALFLDVSGAFDNVSHVRLLHNLRKRRVDLRIVKWIRNFLRGRFTSIRTNEAATESSEIDTGIPQGSPLSPILYLFYNADLLDIGSKYGAISTSGFIDDVMLTATGETFTENVVLLGKVHVEAVEWAKKYGCQFSISKYQLTHFSKKNEKEIDLPLNLGAELVPANPYSRFLGVTYSANLSKPE